MSDTPPPTRLVKLLLPADLVRRMDRAILASGGGYQDRNEFVTEAIGDRLNEEAALAGGEPSPSGAADRAQPPAHLVSPTPAAGELDAVAPSPADGRARGAMASLGTWRRNGACTLPARRSDGVSFGLHNRDFPTLWALDFLATMASGSPARWERFEAAVREQGAALGGRLRLDDVSAPAPLAAGVGFPKPGLKRFGSVDRFIAAMVGSQRRGDGPLFDLALADFADPAHETVAPTDAALDALGDMVEAGLGGGLPHPAAAFARWWMHLGHWAPAEQAAWRKVLRVVAQRPTRLELVARFPEWRGSTADTNTTGFVSRSREWGLVTPEMDDGRYTLTDLGAAVAGEG